MSRMESYDGRGGKGDKHPPRTQAANAPSPTTTNILGSPPPPPDRILSGGMPDHLSDLQKSLNSIPSDINMSRPSNSSRPLEPRRNDKPIIIWDIQTGDNASTEADGSGSHSSGECAVVAPLTKRSRSSTIDEKDDVLSDPGSRPKLRVANEAGVTKRDRSASDVGGPTAIKSSTGHTIQRNVNELDIPVTSAQRRQRIEEIMNRRTEKNRKTKKKKEKHPNHNSSAGSVLSGASTDTYGSIKKGGEGSSPYDGYISSSACKDKRSLSLEVGTDSRWKFVETEKTYSSGDIKARSNVNLCQLLNREHMKKELETKMNQSKRVESGSSVSEGSSNTRASSKASRYTVDKKFTTSSDTPTKPVASSNIPQSADEHKARLIEIMNKRESKASSTKSGDVDSSISDISSGVLSGISSKVSSGVYSGISSHSKKSKVSQGKLRHARPEKKLDDDKSSHVSGASSTSSGIFAVTRAKLKGYLSSYSRKNSTARARGEKPSTLHSTPSRHQGAINHGTPNTMPVTPSSLDSIGEHPFPEIEINLPEDPPAQKGAGLNLLHTLLGDKPVASSSPSPISGHAECTTKIINLLWWMDEDGNQIREKRISGYYSGPVNELLQPHGKGELVLEDDNRIFPAFHGTWENGKLVTPLTEPEDPEPLTEDEASVEQPKHVNAALSRAESARYTLNKGHHLRAKRSVASNKAGNKSHKRKPLVRYNLGDACRTPQDMVILRSKQEAIESASVLKKWDGAFIKRSCGAWTYAILIERAHQPVNVLKRRLEYFYWATVSEVDPRDELEDSMLFAIDGDGSTKIIPKHAWARYIRRVDPNPVPNIPKSKQPPMQDVPIRVKSASRDEKNDPPSSDPPTTCPNTPSEPFSPEPVVVVRPSMVKRTTEETRTTSGSTTLHSPIESHFEEHFSSRDSSSFMRDCSASFMRDSVSFGGSGSGSFLNRLSSGSGEIYMNMRCVEESSDALRHLVDSEKGSNPSVYEE